MKILNLLIFKAHKSLKIVWCDFLEFIECYLKESYHRAGQGGLQSAVRADNVCRAAVCLHPPRHWTSASSCQSLTPRRLTPPPPRPRPRPLCRLGSYSLMPAWVAATRQLRAPSSGIINLGLSQILLLIILEPFLLFGG